MIDAARARQRQARQGPAGLRPAGLLAVTFAATAAIASAMPYAVRSAHRHPATPQGFPGWPAAYEGRDLTLLALTPREQHLARGLPGRIARFSDGRSEIVLRWVVGATRQLHPVADCFRGIGWRVANAPMQLSADGRPMSCIRVTGPDGQRLGVCERIVSVAHGADGPKEFPDVSAWYWHALWHGRHEAWWSIVVATPL